MPLSKCDNNDRLSGHDDGWGSDGKMDVDDDGGGGSAERGVAGGVAES